MRWWLPPCALMILQIRPIPMASKITWWKASSASRKATKSLFSIAATWSAMALSMACQSSSLPWYMNFLTALSSRLLRKKRSSSTCLRLIRETRVPRWGKMSTRLSPARRISASRTGLRLTCSCSPSSQGWFLTGFEAQTEDLHAQGMVDLLTDRGAGEGGISLLWSALVIAS